MIYLSIYRPFERIIPQFTLLQEEDVFGLKFRDSRLQFLAASASDTQPFDIRTTQNIDKKKTNLDLVEYIECICTQFGKSLA